LWIHQVVDTWDEAKRRVTLAERGLDFADAHLVFAGNHYTRAADRGRYGEERFITAGFLRRRFVVVVWTPRDGGRRIISMRHGHGREKARFQRMD
jgi:uncharacterized DUF497 family protein